MSEKLLYSIKEETKYLTEKIWYTIKSGSVIQVDAVDEKGNTVYGKTRLFRLLKDFAAPIPGDIPLEEIK